MRTRLDGREAFVYVLIEHQSSPDRMMPLRMLRYLIRIWDRYLDEHPKAKRLPMIVPLVVYQGSRRWTHPVELGELLDIDPETAHLAGEFLPRFRFLLDDLTKLDKTTLRARPITIPIRLTVRLLRIVPAHPGDVIAALDADDVDDFRYVLRHPGGRELWAAYLTYIQTDSEPPHHRLAWLAAQIGPEAEEVYMSTADTLRAEGRAEGAPKERPGCWCGCLLASSGRCPTRRERGSTQLRWNSSRPGLTGCSTPRPWTTCSTDLLADQPTSRGAGPTDSRTTSSHGIMTSAAGIGSPSITVRSRSSIAVAPMVRCGRFTVVSGGTIISATSRSLS